MPRGRGWMGFKNPGSFAPTDLLEHMLLEGQRQRRQPFATRVNNVPCRSQGKASHIDHADAILLLVSVQSVA